MRFFLSGRDGARSPTMESCAVDATAPASPLAARATHTAAEVGTSLFLLPRGPAQRWTSPAFACQRCPWARWRQCLRLPLRAGANLGSVPPAGTPQGTKPHLSTRGPWGAKPVAEGIAFSHPAMPSATRRLAARTHPHPLTVKEFPHRADQPHQRSTLLCALTRTAAQSADPQAAGKSPSPHRLAPPSPE